MDNTHLSLFSGVGGLDIAFTWAGWQTVGMCEWADYQRDILAKRFPGVPIWRDIRTLTKEDFYAKTGLRTVNLITGGFPCQPFSSAGKRRGVEDDRYLWPEMLRVVSELKPAWFVGENVAGLVSMAQPGAVTRVESREFNRLPGNDYYRGIYTRRENMLLPQILRDVERIGYAVQVFAFPACAVDAPHQRMRIAIVGNAGHDVLAGRDGAAQGGKGPSRNEFAP